MDTKQKNFRLAPEDIAILQETVDLGRALSKADALRTAIRILGESNQKARA